MLIYDYEYNRLIKMRDSISLDVEKHEEHNVLDYAVAEIERLHDENQEADEQLYEEIGTLEDYVDELEGQLISLEEELIDTDTIIDTLEDYYSRTLTQLSDKAGLRGLKASGTKAELVRRIFDDMRLRGELL